MVPNDELGSRVDDRAGGVAAEGSDARRPERALDRTYRQTLERWFPLALFGLAFLLVLLLIAPFAAPFFTASVLAGILFPVQHALQRACGGRPRVAAGLLTAGTALVIVLPAAFLGLQASREVARAWDWTRDTVRREGFEGLVERLPPAVQGPALAGLEATLGWLWPEAVDREGPADSPADAAGAPPRSAPQDASLPLLRAARGANEILLGAGAVLLDLAVLLLLLFFLLTDGTRLVSYGVRLVPLEARRARDLLGEMRRTTAAVILATAVTAVVQAGLAALAYWIVSLPLLPLAIVATFVFAFVPTIGAGGTCVGAGVLLLLSSAVWEGIFLIAWGLLLVGTVDNVLRPWLTGGRIHVPRSLVFFSMICGLAAFGTVGLLAGPVILALFLASERLIDEDGPSQHPGPVESASSS